MLIRQLIKPFHSGYLQSVTFANSEDPDEMLLYCRISSVSTVFVKINTIFMNKYASLFRIFLPVTPQNTNWAIPYLFFQHVWENPSEWKGLIYFSNCNGAYQIAHEFIFSVVYVFDAQSGKPLGDGKPITHKVTNHFRLNNFSNLQLAAALNWFKPGRQEIILTWPKSCWLGC